MANETVLLNFQINTGDAIAELEKTKKVTLDLKTEQQALNKAYKEGTITQEEYISETVRIEQVTKKANAQYQQLTKVVNTTNNSLEAQRLALSKLVSERNKVDRSTEAGVKKFNELNASILELNNSIKQNEQAGGDFRRNVGNYTESIKDSIGSIRVAGTSLGDLTAKMASFVNPVTGVIAALGALGAAYARSSIGAKDLEFAKNRLTSAVNILTDRFAALFSSEENGEGFFSRLLDNVLSLVKYIPIVSLYTKVLGVDLDEINEKSKAAALASDQLNEI